MSLNYPPNVFDDPRQMPEFRRGLLDFTQHPAWRESEMIRRMNEFASGVSGRTMMKDTLQRDGDNLVISGPIGYTADELPRMVEVVQIHTAHAMDWYERSIEESQLVHVSSELSDVLFASVDTVPDDTVLDEGTPPTPYGLVIFQTPFIGMDSGDEFEHVRVDAVLWGKSVLPVRDGDPLDTAGTTPAYSFAAFRWMDPANQDDDAADAARVMQGNLGGIWLPLGRSDWIIGDRLDTPTHVGIEADSRVHASMVEDRRLLSALWALIRSKRVTERTTVQASRASRRRLERRGDTLDPTVEVVHLRRPEYRPQHDDGSTGRRIGVRFVVRPHFRNQAYGPGRTLRRLILVPPHVKGPEDAPFKHVERVWSIDQ